MSLVVCFFPNESIVLLFRPHRPTPETRHLESTPYRDGYSTTNFSGIKQKHGLCARSPEEDSFQPSFRLNLRYEFATYPSAVWSMEYGVWSTQSGVAGDQTVQARS